MNDSAVDQSCSETPEFFCELCSLEFSTKNDLDEHCWTLLHHRKIDEKKGRNCSHQCTLCDEDFFGLMAITTHINGEKHREAAQKWRTKYHSNEWSFNESRQEDESVFSDSSVPAFKKGSQKTWKKNRKGHQINSSPSPQVCYREGGLPWRDGKVHFERQSRPWNRTIANSNQNGSQISCVSRENQNISRKWQERSFDKKNDESHKEPRSGGKSRNLTWKRHYREEPRSGDKSRNLTWKRQYREEPRSSDKPRNLTWKRHRDYVSENFSDYSDPKDQNYQDFEGTFFVPHALKPKRNFARFLEFDDQEKGEKEANIDRELSKEDNITENSQCLQGIESRIENSECSAASVTNSGYVGSRGRLKEGENLSEVRQLTISYESDNEYYRSLFDKTDLRDKYDKESEGTGESVTNGNHSGSRPKEQERRNPRKGKPHKLLANNSFGSSLDAGGNESVMSVSSDQDSFHSQAFTSTRRNKMLQDGVSKEGAKNLDRHRKYAKEMEERMTKFQGNAISSGSHFLDDISISTIDTNLDDSIAVKQENSSPLFFQECAGNFGQFSEEKETVKSDSMTFTSSSIVNSEANCNEAGRTSDLSKDEREEVLRSALGIKKEPLDLEEEISTASYCSAVIKEERETNTESSTFISERNDVRVSGSDTAAEEGPSSSTSSNPNPNSITMALTTTSISPLRPRCIFVQANGVRCGAVKWKGEYCNYHWWLDAQKGKVDSFKDSSNTSSVTKEDQGHQSGLRMESKGSIILSPSSCITTPVIGDSLPKRFLTSQLRPRRASTGTREEDRFDTFVPSVSRVCPMPDGKHGHFPAFLGGRRSSLNASIDNTIKVPQTCAKEGSPFKLGVHIKQEEGKETAPASSVSMIDLNDSTGLMEHLHHLHADVANIPSGQNIPDKIGSTSSVIRFGTSPPKALTPERKSSVSSLDRSPIGPAIPYFGSGSTKEFRSAMPGPSPSPKNVAVKHDIPNRHSPKTKIQMSPGGELSGALRFPKSSGDSPTGSFANISLDLSMTNLPPAVRRALALRYGSKKVDGESVALPITVAPNISKSRSRFVERSKVQTQSQSQGLPQVENQAKLPADHSVWKTSSSVAASRAARSRRSVSLDSRTSIQFEQMDFLAGRQNIRNIPSLATSENNHDHKKESCTTSVDITRIKTTNSATELAAESAVGERSTYVHEVRSNVTNLPLNKELMQNKSSLIDLSSTSYFPTTLGLTTKDPENTCVMNTYANSKHTTDFMKSRFSPASVFLSENASLSDESVKSHVVLQDHSLIAGTTSSSGLMTNHDSNNRFSSQLEGNSTIVSNVVNFRRPSIDAGQSINSGQRSVSPLISHTTGNQLWESGSFANKAENVTKSDTAFLPDTNYDINDRKLDSDNNLSAEVKLTEMMDLNTKPYVTVRNDVNRTVVEDSRSSLQSSPLRYKRPVQEDSENQFPPELSTVKRIRDSDKLNTENKNLSYAPGVNVDGLLRLEREEQEQMQALNSVQSRLKLVRSHIQKLCTELDSLHSEENRIVGRMSQLRSSRLQILQHAVCEQRLSLQGAEEFTVGESELDPQWQENRIEDATTAQHETLTVDSSSASPKNYCSETLSSVVDVGVIFTSSTASSVESITYTVPNTVSTAQIKDSDPKIPLVTKPNLHEFGKTASLSLTSVTFVESTDSSPKKCSPFGHKLRKRRSVSLDDSNISIRCGSSTNESTESERLNKNNSIQELSNLCNSDDVPHNEVSSLNQEQSFEVKRESPSTDKEVTKCSQLKNDENIEVRGDKGLENIREKLEEEHRADALRKMSRTMAQSKQKLESVRQEIEQLKKEAECMTKKAAAKETNSHSNSQQRNSRNSPQLEFKRQKHHHEEERKNSTEGKDTLRCLRRSPERSTAASSNKHKESENKLTKSNSFHSGNRELLKEKKRKQRERHSDKKRSKNEHNKSTKRHKIEKTEEISKKDRKLSDEGKPKTMPFSVTENTCETEAVKSVEAGLEIDRIPTRDVPSSSSVNASINKSITSHHLKIPSSTVSSFRKRSRGKSTASKPPVTTFASTFEGHTSAVCGIQVSEGHMFTCSADKTSRSFDIQTGKCVKTFQGHHQAVNCLQVSPDGQKLFTGSNDKSVRSYNIKNGSCSHILTFDGRVMSLHIAFDLLFVGLSTGVVATVCLESNTCVQHLHCHEPRAISCLATATEGQRRLLCTGSYDSNITIRDHKSGLLLKTLSGHQMTVLCLKVVENVIYSGAADKKALAHDINTGELLRSYDGHEMSVTGLQVVGRVVVTSCLDKLVRCYDLMSSELLQVYGGQTEMIFCLHMANGRIYTGSRNGSVTSVKLDLRVYHPCKWKDCKLNFGIVSHLQDHIRDYHVMQQGNLERCQWLKCNQEFSQGDDISVIVTHVQGHVELRRSRNSTS